MRVQVNIPQHYEADAVEAIRNRIQEFIEEVLHSDAEVTMVKVNSITLTFRMKDTWDLANIHSDIISGIFRQRFIFWLEDMGLEMSTEEQRSVTTEITAIVRVTEVNKGKSQVFCL